MSFTWDSSLMKDYNSFLREVDQLEIWRRILGKHVNLGEYVCSPFRVDRNPRCYLQDFKGTIVLTDWSNYQFRNVGTIKAIMLTENCSYNKALTKSFDYTLPSSNFRKILPKKRKSFQFQLEFKYRNYNRLDEQYWNQFGITIEQLKKEKIFPVSYYFCNSKQNPNKLKCYKADKLAYGISINNRRKLYQPNRSKEDRKFISSLNYQFDIGGIWDRSSRVLGIVTSFKDYMPCKYYTPYNYSYVPCESISLNIFFIDVINDRFDYIFLLGDNDREGLEFNKRLCKQIGKKSFPVLLPQWNDPAQYYSKEQNLNFINESVREILNTSIMETSIRKVV